MKKVIRNRLDFKTGKFEEESVEIKTKNFTEGEAASYFRTWLIEKGYKDDIGSKVIDKNVYGKLQYLTLFDKSIKCSFCLWQALKDTDGGKAVFWIGEDNSANHKEVEYGIIINNRIIPTDIYWRCLIVAPRDTFKIGTSFKNQAFVDFLLIPLNDIIEEIKVTKKPCIDIRKSHREKYKFEKMIEIFKSSEDLL
jgi:hypothetical protein